MSTLRHVTRQDILDTMDTFDDKGPEAFLELSGYQPAKLWQIRYKGRSYPSKAILGVAAGLKASEFFGGIAQTIPALERLGFQIRKGARATASREITDRVKNLGMFARSLRLPVDVVAYFHSGSNRPGEIKGLGAIGADLGVAAGEILKSTDALDAILDLGGTDVQVFVDSGAFSEVDADLNVVAPIAPAEWRKILDLYKVLAVNLGSQLWIVAPDRVGDQTTTLERIRTYAADLRALEALGARVLLPVQKGDVLNGDLTQADFYLAASRLLGFAPIPALPCKKGATTPAEASAFFTALDERKIDEPGVVHFLGLGARNAKLDAYLEAAGDRRVTLDSNWIRANVGRQGKTRRYTAGRDLAATLVAGAALVAELGMIIAQSAATIAAVTPAQSTLF